MPLGTIILPGQPGRMPVTDSSVAAAMVVTGETPGTPVGPSSVPSVPIECLRIRAR